MLRARLAAPCSMWPENKKNWRIPSLWIYFGSLQSNANSFQHFPWEHFLSHYLEIFALMDCVIVIVEGLKHRYFQIIFLDNIYAGVSRHGGDRDVLLERFQWQLRVKLVSIVRWFWDSDSAARELFVKKSPLWPANCDLWFHMYIVISRCQ